MFRVILYAALALVHNTPANAAEAACTYVNLYDQLEHSDPQAYADIEAKAEETANGRGIFYKITSDDSTHISWLFGTMHSADQRVLDVALNVMAALRTSDVFVGELDDSRVAYDLAQVRKNAPELFILPQGESLEDMLDADTVKHLDLLLNQRNSDFDQFNLMQPWVLMAAAESNRCEFEQQAAGRPYLDQLLGNKAREFNLKVVGLETIGSQIEALTAVNPDYYYNSLRDVADLHRRGIIDDINQTNTELYLSEEIGTLVPFDMHYFKHLQDDGGRFQSFQYHLLDIRNKTMLSKSIPLVAQGPTFIAVGALHLTGQSGLVEGFRKAGYSVERVELTR